MRKLVRNILSRTSDLFWNAHIELCERYQFDSEHPWWEEETYPIRFKVIQLLGDIGNYFDTLSIWAETPENLRFLEVDDKE